MTTKLSLVLDFEGAPLRFSLLNGQAVVDAGDVLLALKLTMEANPRNGIVRLPDELGDPSNPRYELAQRFSRWLQDAAPRAADRLRKSRIGMRSVSSAKGVA
jgi:hypothetical protein